MFLNNTVVVVGAGASCEAGLPLGATLKSEISKLTKFQFSYGGFKDGDYDFWQDLLRSSHFSGDQKRASSACAKISRGILFVSSVDSFLEIHRSDADIQHCAKSAIVKLILDGERRSKLHISDRNIHNTLDTLKLEGTWFQELAHAIFEGVDANDVSAAFLPVTFISFNYDRCIEWFLYNAIQGLYFLSKSQALSAITPLKVLYPYGEVGAPGWLGASDGSMFGDDSSVRITRAQGRIQTFTERALTPETIQLVREVVTQASTLIFLGFAFHPQNMELLRSEDSKDPSGVCKIYGTSVGMSEEDCSTIENELVHRFRVRNSAEPRVTLRPITCSEFMRQFKRSITSQSRPKLQPIKSAC